MPKSNNHSKNPETLLLFQALQILDDSITPKRCKIHLAVWNGSDDPLDVYLAGRFDDWQAWQTKKNFGRDLVVSLIALPERNHWLFAGVHDVHGCKQVGTRANYRYALTRRETTESLCGRMVIHFDRTGRQSYLLAERWATSLQIAELRAQRLQVSEFPGYTRTILTKQQLDIIVKQQSTSWKSALSSVSGIYVISDCKTGKLYIGSATGEGGIWGRWCAYSATGHGGNRELRKLLKKKGANHAAGFQYGILETADSRATDEDIRARESHWKDLLLSRTHGYNAN